jgi:hypothetical protein
MRPNTPDKENSMSNESTLAKIRALMAKTVDSGCTEAEALLAAKKVAELMDKHGFETADLEVKEAITEETFFYKGKQMGGVAYCCVEIARFCDVKVWASRRGERAVTKFFGRESDVAAAVYLTHLFHNAMTGAWGDYYERQVAPIPSAARPHGRTLRMSFEHGMASRLNERLRGMKVARNQTVDTASGRTGRDLVVAKDREVSVAFRALSLNLRGGGNTRVRVNSTAAAYGRAAGDRVSIVTGVGRGFVAGLLA